MIIRRLADGTLRFAQLRRSVDGISQKVLTNILRSLERDGIVTRRIYASVPPKVEYSLTNLGRSLCNLVEGICCWAEANIERVQAAREVYSRTPCEDSIPQYTLQLTAKKNESEEFLPHQGRRALGESVP